METVYKIIIGCLPQNSPIMYESIKAGHIVDSTASPTLSDGTAGGIEGVSITFGPCQKYVDDRVMVDENEIRQGIKLVFEQHRQVIEGAVGKDIVFATGSRSHTA